MAELGSGSGSSYPGSLDTDSSVESTSTIAREDVPNDLAAAVVAIQTELGTDPAGSLTNVKTNLQTEHNTNGTHNIPTSSYNAGQIIQVVNVSDGAMATGATQTVLDDTTPQNDEGDEYMTLAVTPTAVTSKLRIEVNFMGSHSANDAAIIVALFQDATADALSAAYTTKSSLGQATTIAFDHYMAAGTTSETTFKVRAGGHIAGTTTFNGTGGAQIFNGVMASSITITEIAV